MEALIDLYTYIGYPCFKVSALNKTGIEDIKQDLTGKVTLLSGNSGVGKSTLINETLMPVLKNRFYNAKLQPHQCHPPRTECEDR